MLPKLRVGARDHVSGHPEGATHNTLRTATMAVSSALVGATLALGMVYAGSRAGFGFGDASGMVSPHTDCKQSQGASALVFAHTKAAETLGELSSEEVRAVASWFAERTGAAGARNASPTCVWLAGPSAIELLRPPKATTVAYLDGTGPRPPRFARVTAVGPTGVQEYSVGPLESGRPAPNAHVRPLRKPDEVPYVKRPTEPGADLQLAQSLVNQTLRTIGASLLVSAFGPVFPLFDGYDARRGTIFTSMMRNDVLSPKGQRYDLMKFAWSPPPPRQTEEFWLHPVPLSMHINSTSNDPAQWAVLGINFCSQPFKTSEQLSNAYRLGEVRLCPFQTQGGSWNLPQKESPASPAGRHPIEDHNGVTWGNWSFTVTQRPSTGLALLDVRYGDERILYELAIQDAQAAYSGGRDQQFFYSDASFTMSMLSASLKPGVDCPEGAHYLAAANWDGLQNGGTASSNPLKAKDFWPICIFTWEEDHTIWRHMYNTAPPSVHGLTRRTVIVRSVCTVGNYDYITDVKLREDGEIEVRTRFAGYMESRYYDPAFNPQEDKYSSLIRPDLAGPVHSHAVSFKADFDIAGSRANSLRVTRVKAKPVEDSALSTGPAPLISKYLETIDVKDEGIGKSTFVADPRQPGLWSVVDRKSASAAGNARGYAVSFATWSSVTVLPEDHPFTRAMPFGKYHLAVTKYHDDEYRVDSPYIHYDGMETTRNAQDLDRFLADGEALLDEDLVAWIGLAKEHIVRQEDLPLVSNFGVGFSLQPWNFFQQNQAASPL